MSRWKHLTDLEIFLYLRDTYGPQAQDHEFESHIARCEKCNSRVLELERRTLPISGSSIADRVRSDRCPPEESLRAFALRTCPENAAQEILLHVGDCSYCAPLLKEYLHEIDDRRQPLLAFGRDAMAFLADFISQLKSTMRPSFVYKALAIGALASIVVFTAGPAINAFQIKRATTAVASAFGEVGTTDMRVTWAAGYPKTGLRTRGSKCPSSVDNPELASASYIIAQHTARGKSASDPRWDRLKARWKLLACNGAEAASLLEGVRSRGLNDPGTLIDLAVANYQKDPAELAADADEKLARNSTESLELLQAALRAPDLSEEQRAVALFDLAVVYEKMLLWDEAVRTWKQYLAIDKAGLWHDDAQRRLEKAEMNIPLPKQQGYRTPPFFLRHSSDAAVLDNLEEYQDLALREWDWTEKTETASALRRLADLLDQQHSDSWMKDYLQSSLADDSATLLALGSAIASNRRGQYGQAETEAGKAMAGFEKTGNYPGMLRARFEKVYARHRVMEEKPCLKQALTLERELLHTRYQWLKGQIHLEQSACLAFEMLPKAAKEQIDQAGHIAAEYNLHMLDLRTYAMQAAILVSTNCDEADHAVRDGLSKYWSGISMPSRLYEFYSPIKQCLEKRKRWLAAEALERGMIAILERAVDPKDENVLLEITAHRALAQILKHHDGPAAQDQERLALSLLDRVDKKVAGLYEVPINLELAEFQMNHNKNSAAALTIVQKIEQNLPSANAWMRLKAARVRGDAEFMGQDFEKANRNYQEGLEIVEKALSHSGGRQRQQWAEETGDVYRGLVQVLVKQKNYQEALQIWESYQTRLIKPAVDTQENLSKQTWIEIEQDILSLPVPPPSPTRLVYISTKNYLYIFIIDNSGLRIVPIETTRDDLQQEISQYKEICSMSPEQGLPLPEADSKALFDLLVKPVLADLRDSEPIAIDIDPAMNGLPIEALRSPEGWYFGERYPIVRSPGYLTEIGLRRPTQQPLERGFVIDALTEKNESEAIHNLFPKWVVRGDAALSLAELPMLLNESETFVFIGHAKSGALIFSNSRPVMAEDFPVGSLRSLRLVVLAGCSTANVISKSMDTSDLVHAFQSAGSSQYHCNPMGCPSVRLHQGSHGALLYSYGQRKIRSSRVI